MEIDQEILPDSMMEDDQDSHRTETVAPPPSGSADKPLRVKIKFSSMKENAEEDMEDGPKVKDHCCVECKKRFNSGKALGGHMSSAHVQANKDFPLKKLKSKTRRPKKLMGSSPPSDYGGKIICKICGKDFRTNKSLFGHMRCHPDREWRGMEPPAEAEKNYLEPEFEAMNEVPSHVDDGDQIDSGPHVVASTATAEGLNKSVKWLVTGKRGREPTKPLIDSPPLQSSEEIIAVQQLIRLVNGDSLKPSEDLDSKVMEGEATSSNSCTSENETDMVNQGFQLNKNKEKVFPVRDERDSPVKKLKFWEITDENPGSALVRTRRILYNGKGNVKLNPGFETENSISSDYSLDDKSGNNGSMLIKKKTEEEKKSMDPESPQNFSLTGPACASDPPAVTPDKYVCNTCKKSFPTPQALGGHRSSHKKFKVKVHNTIDDQSSNEVSHVKYKPKSNANVLGVQNQCHCTGNQCNHADHVTSKEEAKKEHKVLLKFDLNKIPSQDIG